MALFRFYRQQYFRNSQVSHFGQLDNNIGDIQGETLEVRCVTRNTIKDKDIQALALDT